MQDVQCPILGMVKKHTFQSVQVETRLKSRDKIRLKESEVLKMFLMHYKDELKYALMTLLT